MTATTLIQIPSVGSASLVEIIWLTTGLAVVFFSASGIPETIRLWNTALSQDDALMQVLAGGYVRREAIRVVQGVVIAAIGVYGCLTGPAIPGPVVVSPVGLVLTCGLLLIGLTIAVQSVLDRHQQSRAHEELDQADP